MELKVGKIAYAKLHKTLLITAPLIDNADSPMGTAGKAVGTSPAPHIDYPAVILGILPNGPVGTFLLGRTDFAALTFIRIYVSKFLAHGYGHNRMPPGLQAGNFPLYYTNSIYR